MRCDHTAFSERPVVWDYVRSRKVEHVMWVDEDAKQYSVAKQPVKIVNGSIVAVTHYAHIRVWLWGLVVINPPSGFTYDMAKQLHDLVKT